VWWFVSDYRAFGTRSIQLDEHTLHLRIGRRFDITLPVASVARAFAPSFRDLPAPGTNQGREYINVTKPAAPNVLIELDAPRRVRLRIGIHRDVRRLSLHVDDAPAFIRALQGPRA
jgi:hypothetical protein